MYPAQGLEQFHQFQPSFSFVVHLIPNTGSTQLLICFMSLQIIFTFLKFHRIRIQKLCICFVCLPSQHMLLEFFHVLEDIGSFLFLFQVSILLFDSIKICLSIYFLMNICVFSRFKPLRIKHLGQVFGIAIKMLLGMSLFCMRTSGFQSQCCL